MKKKKEKKKRFITVEPVGMKQWNPSSMPVSPKMELNFEYDH